MTLVLFAFGIRFLMYSFLTNPWYILPVELLQGVTYGIFYSNMASYAYVVSPPGSAATVQGIVGAAFEGVGENILLLTFCMKILSHYKIHYFQGWELEALSEGFCTN